MVWRTESSWRERELGSEWRWGNEFDFSSGTRESVWDGDYSSR